MIPVSIVIITKNEADVIAGCLQKAKLITDDIVIVDSGSTDRTLQIAAAYDCRVFEKTWDGYGANKNKGIQLAKYNWILSIDADEFADDELINALHQLSFDNAATVYDIRFRSYFGDKMIRYGSWGRDHHIRLFNRLLVKWSETIVHETLILPENTVIKKLAGRLHHHSVKSFSEYYDKCRYYARLSAKQYFNSGKKAGAIKLIFSPLFGFIKNYLFRLGFLDGRAGWQIAKLTLKNTRRKYVLLNQLEITHPKNEPAKEKFVVEY